MHGHRGAYFPETLVLFTLFFFKAHPFDLHFFCLHRMWKFGTWVGTNYGCPNHRKGVGFQKNSYQWPDCPYLRHYRTQGLELASLMLEAYLHGDHRFGPTFAIDVMVPVITEVLRYFYEHYEMNLQNEMVMRSQALETWQECVNPTTDIAGLTWVTNKTLDLPFNVLPADSEARAMVTALLAQVPSMEKVISEDSTGERFLDHCQWVTIEQNNNVENVELYAVHPFPLYGNGFSEELPFIGNVTGGGEGAMRLINATYARRKFHNPISSASSNGGPSIGEWQEGMQAARLGYADEAAENVQLRASWGNVHLGPYSSDDDGKAEHVMRFPAFYGPLSSDGNAYPDLEHLASMRTTLQMQLLQNDGNRILLFGGWPAGEDVSFKLHARQGTVVEASCSNGKIVSMNVVPQTRRKDIVIVGDACVCDGC